MGLICVVFVLMMLGKIKIIYYYHQTFSIS
jgi:hypothetical protein